MDTLYPFQLCQPPSPMDACWVGYLLNDPVVVHAVLFCAASVLPTQSTMTWNTRNSFHHLKALQLLQGRFNHCSGEPQVSDATLLAIVTLVLTAQYLDDRASDAAHVNGLYQVTILRGGIDHIGSGGWGSQDLVAKIVDLGHAIRYNLKPTYFREHTSWARCTAQFKTSGSFKLTDLRELLPGVNSRLADIWDDLAHFSHQSNVATRTDLKFTRNNFNDILLSIQYRLHHLALQDEDRVAESVRVAMLAISSFVFLGYQIHSDTQQPLEEPLQEAVDGLICNEADVPWKVAFWLVMTLKSLASPKSDQQLHEAYLLKAIRPFNVTCWEEAQKILRSMIWIDFIQDGKGRIAFEHAVGDAVG
ncbi:hypothetical protein LIA77_10787 [Sarocladium implicatum]|nr:hypothetical protein LIA77_10787 [Sarocladium implicatum]